METHGDSFPRGSVPGSQVCVRDQLQVVAEKKLWRGGAIVVAVAQPSQKWLRRASHVNLCWIQQLIKQLTIWDESPAMVNKGWLIHMDLSTSICYPWP